VQQAAQPVRAPLEQVQQVRVVQVLALLVQVLLLAQLQAQALLLAA
jgi:hypothetical protein